MNVAKLYNMLPAEETGTSDGRTAAANATVRSVFIIGPDKKIKLMSSNISVAKAHLRAIKAQSDETAATYEKVVLAALEDAETS